GGEFGVAPAVPLVRMSCHGAKCPLLALASDEQGDMRARRRTPRGCIDSEVVAAELRTAVVEQGAKDDARFFEPVGSLSPSAQTEAGEQRFVLLPAGTEAQHEAATAELLECRGCTGERCWMSVGDWSDERSEAKPL